MRPYSPASAVVADGSDGNKVINVATLERVEVAKVNDQAGVAGVSLVVANHRSHALTTPGGNMALTMTDVVARHNAVLATTIVLVANGGVDATKEVSGLIVNSHITEGDGAAVNVVV